MLTETGDMPSVRIRNSQEISVWLTTKISLQHILLNVPYASLLPARLSPSRVSWLISKIRLVLVQVEETTSEVILFSNLGPFGSSFRCQEACVNSNPTDPLTLPVTHTRQGTQKAVSSSHKLGVLANLLTTSLIRPVTDSLLRMDT